MRGAVSQGCSLLPYRAVLLVPGGAQQGIFYAIEVVGLILLCKGQSHPGKMQQGVIFPWPGGLGGKGVGALQEKGALLLPAQGEPRPDPASIPASIPQAWGHGAWSCAAVAGPLQGGARMG